MAGITRPHGLTEPQLYRIVSFGHTAGDLLRPFECSIARLINASSLLYGQRGLSHVAGGQPAQGSLTVDRRPLWISPVRSSHIVFEQA